MTWTMPANISRMSKRRQKIALMRYVKRRVDIALMTFIDHPNTAVTRLNMVDEIVTADVTYNLPKLAEHITLNFVVAPPAGGIT